MQRYADTCVDVRFEARLQPSILRLRDLVTASPDALLPVRGADDVLASLFSSHGFQLYPTVRSTTLCYDPAADCFLKILHPLRWRRTVRYRVTDRARQIHALAEWLIGRGVPVSRVRAFGRIGHARKPFFAVDRVEGQSLYDILVRAQRAIPAALGRTVIERVAAVHRLGFLLGDAHLSHIFVHDGEVSGFIDIDAIRRNRPFGTHNLARDIAGLNHPGVALAEREKAALLAHYMRRMSLRDKQGFQRLVRDYSAERWKAYSATSAAPAP